MLDQLQTPSSIAITTIEMRFQTAHVGRIYGVASAAILIATPFDVVGEDVVEEIATRIAGTIFVWPRTRTQRAW